MGPLYHMPPAKMFAGGVTERLVSVGAADLECVCFETATEILIGPWHTQIILFTLWGDKSHSGLLQQGVCVLELYF